MSRLITVQDLELFYSGAQGHPFLDMSEYIAIKKDVGTITSTLGEQTWNAIYGAQVWAQLNMEANAFGILPKETWIRSGWRVITDFAWNGLTNGIDDLAIGETSPLPDAIRPPIEIVKTRPKFTVNTFEVSDVIEALAEVSQDDVYGTAEHLRRHYGDIHRKAINRLILKKVMPSDAYGSSTAVTVNSNQVTPLDLIVSSYDEMNSLNVDIANSDTPYGVDRSTADSWANAYVNHNGGTARSLTDDIIRETIQGVRENGANTTVILTGYDTYYKLQGIYMNFVRYLPMGETAVQFGLNGIQTAKGIDAGVKVASLYGIPMITAVDTPKDDISRIYMLDTSDTEGYGMARLGFMTARPTEYFETRDFLLLNKFVVKGAYRTVGDVACRFFKAQAKIRDLQ